MALDDKTRSQVMADASPLMNHGLSQSTCTLTVPPLKQNKEYSTEDFTLQKGVQSFLTHDRFIPSRFVPKFSPFVLSLSRFVPEILHARVREHISVVANDEKVESGEKDSIKVRSVYL